MSTQTKTVSFRLSPEHYRALEEIAEAEKTTIGDVSRARVIASLHGDNEAVREIKVKLETLQRSVDEVTHDLPVLTQGLLLAASRKEPIDAEEAAEWVRENLRTTS